MTLVRSYLFSQFLRSSGAVSLVLLAIGVVDVLFRLVRHDVDPATAAQLAILYLVNAVVGSILPLGVYFGLFMVIGRLCQSQELYSMYGNGIPRAEVRRVLFILIVPIMVFSTMVSFFVYPALKLRMGQLNFFSDQERVNVVLDRGGIFSHGALTATRLPATRALNAGDDESGAPEERLLLVHRRDDSYLVQIARQSETAPARTGRSNTYGFHGGRVYYRHDGRDSLGHFHYQDGSLSLLRQTQMTRALHHKEKNLLQLLSSHRQSDRIEVQRRLLAPLLFLISFIFAIYCAEILPRQSSYSRIPQAMIMLVAVFLVIRFGADAIKEGIIPMAPGMWIFLPLIAMLALLLYRVRR